jgi:hypothetical protein
MTLAALTQHELEVVHRSMVGTFQYLEFDFEARLGVSQENMRDLLGRWPDVDDTDDNGIACLAINNALNDLLHGVGISDDAAIELTGANRSEMYRIYKKWASARGWSATGVC